MRTYDEIHAEVMNLTTLDIVMLRTQMNREVHRRFNGACDDKLRGDADPIETKPGKEDDSNGRH